MSHSGVQSLQDATARANQLPAKDPPTRKKVTKGSTPTENETLKEEMDQLRREAESLRSIYPSINVGIVDSAKTLKEARIALMKSTIAAGEYFNNYAIDAQASVRTVPCRAVDRDTILVQADRSHGTSGS